MNTITNNQNKTQPTLQLTTIPWSLIRLNELDFYFSDPSTSIEVDGDRKEIRVYGRDVHE